MDTLYFLVKLFQLFVIEVVLAQKAVAYLDFDLAVHNDTTVVHPEFSIGPIVGLNICIPILDSWHSQLLVSGQCLWPVISSPQQNHLPYSSKNCRSY